MPRGRSKKQLLNSNNNNMNTTSAQTAEMRQTQLEQEPLKELEPKVTVIARQNYKLTLPDGSMVQELFDVTYGNLLLPIIESKGPIAIKKAKYMEFLEEFFASEEGKKYRRPSQQEIESAMNGVRAEIEAYKNRQMGIKGIPEQKPAEQTAANIKPTPEPVQTPAPDNQPVNQPQTQTTPVEQGPTAQQVEQQRQMTVMQEELARQQQVFSQNQAAIQQQIAQFNGLKEEAEKTRKDIEELKKQMSEEQENLTRIQNEKKEALAKSDPVNDEPAEVKTESFADLKPLKIFSIASMVLSLLTLALLGIMFLRSANAGQGTADNPEAPQVFDGEGTLNINGKEYTVPLSTIKIENGQTKTVFYAVETSLDENGEPSADAYPIGTWVFDSAKVKMSEETPETPPADTNN